MRTRLILILALAALALALAGCGGDDDSGEGTTGISAEGASTEIPGGAEPEDVEVIREWADTLRSGDAEGAAELFALPSRAQNGTPPLLLEERADVVEFNEALPCGAELVRAEDHAEFVLATFELSERPGPGECGAGTGNTAMTAFVIEDGKIVQWVRAAGEEEPPEPTGPVV
jgi:hypothetical protein